MGRIFVGCDVDHRGSFHALPLLRKHDCAHVKSSRDDLTNSGYSADEVPVEARKSWPHGCDRFQNIRFGILGLLALRAHLTSCVFATSVFFGVSTACSMRKIVNAKPIVVEVTDEAQAAALLGKLTVSGAHLRSTTQTGNDAAILRSTRTNFYSSRHLFCRPLLI